MLDSLTVKAHLAGVIRIINPANASDSMKPMYGDLLM